MSGSPLFILLTRASVDCGPQNSLLLNAFFIPKQMRSVDFQSPLLLTPESNITMAICRSCSKPLLHKTGAGLLVI